MQVHFILVFRVGWVDVMSKDVATCVNCDCDGSYMYDNVY